MIDVDSNRPFEPFINMTTSKWLAIPPQPVALDDIVWSQPGVSIEGMLRAIAGERSYSGDAYPHFVDWDGRRYLSDGHHRVVVALARGAKVVDGRVLVV